MVEQITTPNRLKRLVIKGTAIAATAGAGALSLTGCTPRRPGLDEFSHCDESITAIDVKDNAVVRSEPVTDGDAEGPSNVIVKVEFNDDANYEVEEFLNVPRQIGGACIRVARGFGGDGNGNWYGIPAAEFAKKFHNKDQQNAVTAVPDGYVWVNEARAKAVK